MSIYQRSIKIFDEKCNKAKDEGDNETAKEKKIKMNYFFF